MLKCSLLFLLLPTYSFAAPDRLSLKQKDLSAVETIFVSPGLVSVIEFPNNIIEVRIGSPETLKVAISQVSPKEITVYLSTSAATPSNLIVRSDRKIYVFDIVPSRTTHQDYIKLSGTYNSPRSHNSLSLIEKQEIKPNFKQDLINNYRIQTEKVKVSP